MRRKNRLANINGNQIDFGQVSMIAEYEGDEKSIFTFEIENEHISDIQT